MCCDLSEYRARIGYYRGGLKGASLFINREVDNLLSGFQYAEYRKLMILLGKMLLLYLLLAIPFCNLLRNCPSSEYKPSSLLLCIVFIIILFKKWYKMSISGSIAYGLADIPIKHKILGGTNIDDGKIKVVRMLFVVLMIFLPILLIINGDIHKNPGPLVDQVSNQCSICHLNIRSLNSSEKIEHIKMDLGGKFDIISISETWLKDSSNF